MLKTLVINNIALIEHIELDFCNGLTVLSGETGSGKSIIIDSLAFVLGERADKTLIKNGAEFAEVSAVFDVDADSPVMQKLDECGFICEGELLLSRKMSLAGKNEIRIQGKIATLQLLKDVCSRLADIFGQGQHLNLLDEANQLQTVDDFCNFGGINGVLADELYPSLVATERELASFGGSDAERERMADVLKYQIDELTNADLSAGEEAELDEQHKRIVNAEKITTALSAACDALESDGGAVGGLASAVSFLHSVSGMCESSDNLAERLVSVRLETEDVLETLRDELSKCEFSPDEIDRIENRRDLVRTLKRKYGGTVADALAFLENAQREYDKLVNSTEQIARLNAQKQQILRKMYDVAQKMSAIRKQTANELSQKIMQELADLGMKGTDFKVEFCDVPSFDEYAQHAGPNGYDSVEFLMSANLGEPLKPLNKVISGGEMSRFMLAVKNITALAEKIPTMVFDEIDTGISGNMARMVATKLANVSKSSYQCIVITHLPQIAAMADVNAYISKMQANGKTHTQVKLLDGGEKVAEVARLMGGVGEKSTDGARELVDWCNRYKQSQN